MFSVYVTTMAVYAVWHGGPGGQQYHTEHFIAYMIHKMHKMYRSYRRTVRISSKPQQLLICTKLGVAWSNSKCHGVRDELVICASGSSSLMSAVLPMDFWLSIRATEFRSLCAWEWDPLAVWLPPIVLSSSDSSAFTRTSKRRFAVGYLDIDLVIPCNLVVVEE